MVTKFGIHLKVKDIYKSFDFYSSFKLKPVFAYGRKEWINMLSKLYPELPHAVEKYEGVTFEINNALFEIANGHVAVKNEVFKQDITSSKVSAMIDTESVDKIVEISKEKGFEIAKEPVKYPWGTREVVVKDPDGFILVFREFWNNYLDN